MAGAAGAAGGRGAGGAGLLLEPIDLCVLRGLLRARLEQLRARLLLLLVLRLELLACLLEQLRSRWWLVGSG